MKITKKSETVQRTFDEEGNISHRITGATYEITMNNGRYFGSANIQDGGSGNIQLSGDEGGVEAKMTLIENIFGNFNEQQES